MASDFDITRYLSANIKHMIYHGKTKKAVKKRWVVFQGNSNTRLFQLKLYKNDSERVLKTSYTLNSDNFVGTERGEIRKNNVTQSSYFAIVLKDDTVIFGLDIDNQGAVEGSTFDEWSSIFDDIFQSGKLISDLTLEVFY
ncbi:hypothetical protein BSL78_15907 [Apostichopus japonicus]|uniref:PH domain-containing protein n=1 Tax=Stichopus japonicus TaxID=307972 RepID=A0A2G8KGW4_STIJA|nr:hypothetical protein BSL78_15907 [Apostichopus japonicus]